MGFIDDFEFGFDQTREPFHDKRVIVREQNTYFLQGPLAGKIPL